LIISAGNYLSTVLDDFSRYIIAWKLCTTMKAQDVTDTLDLALTASGGDVHDDGGGATSHDDDPCPSGRTISSSRSHGRHRWTPNTMGLE